MVLYNVDFVIATILMLFIFFLSFLWNKPLNNKKTRAFYALVFGVLLTAIFDCGSAMISNYMISHVFSRGIAYIVNIIYFLLTTIAIIPFLYYLLISLEEEKLLLSTVFKLLYIPIIVIIAIIITTPMTKLIFYYDHYNIYRHGSLFFLAFIIPHIYVLIGIILTIKYHKRLTRRQFISSLIFSFSVLLG